MAKPIELTQHCPRGIAARRNRNDSGAGLILLAGFGVPVLRRVLQVLAHFFTRDSGISIVAVHAEPFLVWA